MGRLGCECEETQQSDHSPGVVEHEEPIVFVLTDPLTIEHGSVKNFSNSELKEKRLSICRSKHSSGTRLTGESDLGFPILVVRANLAHAHRNIHHSHGL